MFKNFNLKHATAIIVAIAFFAVLGLEIIKTINTYAIPKLAYTVVIDAGHGGIDGGVSGRTTGVFESEINLEIAKRLETAFKNAGFDVVMTRTFSGGLYGLPVKGYKKRDMQKRAEIIKNADPDLFISVHQNYYSDSSRRGAQTFYYDEGDKLFALAVQAELNAMPEATRALEVLFGDYFVLKQANCPSCLIECGFLSNAEDEALLCSEQYQTKIAQTIFSASLKFLCEHEQNFADLNV